MTHSTTTLGNKKSGIARYLPTIARVLLGLLFFVSGIMGFFMKSPAKETMSPGMWEFFQAMIHSGYLFYLVKGTETLVGALLLINRFVPLALTVLAPILINIALVNYFLAPSGIIFSIILIVLELYLVRVYRSAFRPMLASRVTPE